MRLGKKEIILTVFLVFFCVCMLAGCGEGTEDKETAEKMPVPALAGCGVWHDPAFSGVCIDVTADGFGALGFEYGDSVDITFSNGYIVEDIPYYNGFYTGAGKPLLVGGQDAENLKAGISGGEDLWVTAGLREGDTVTVTLREKGGYLDVQNARDLHYEDDRGLFPSDETFANFRMVRGGSIRENILYRSASPCDDCHNRAFFADALMAGVGVIYVLDLADDDVRIGQYFEDEEYSSPYFRSLYESGKVMPLALNMSFGSDEFKGKVVKGLTALAENDGPYLIHCTEGKDRTGFFCMLVEALAGAGYEEIAEDYMITYDNYYRITKEGDETRYSLILEGLLDPMIRSMVGDEFVDIKTADLSSYARRYLTDAGMSGETISKLESRIMKDPGNVS